MQTTIRTTIRIKEDLLRQSRFLALEKGTTLQAVVNELLAQGLGHISDFNRHKEAMRRIEQFRDSFKGKKINVSRLVEKNKAELEERTNRLIGK